MTMTTATPPTPNVPLLRQAVEWVEEQAALPVQVREWNQADWYLTRDLEVHADWLDDLGHTECNTTYCVAGKVCAIEHGPDWNPHKAGTRWSTEARRLLGITDREASNLFDANNNAAIVRRVAEDIAGERL